MCMKKIFRSIVDAMTKTVSISALGLVLYSPESISTEKEKDADLYATID